MYRWNDPDSGDEFSNFARLELPVPDEARGAAEDWLDEAAWKSRAELRYSPEESARAATLAISAPVVAAVLRDLSTHMVCSQDARTVLDLIGKLREA